MTRPEPRPTALELWTRANESIMENIRDLGSLCHVKKLMDGSAPRYLVATLALGTRVIRAHRKGKPKIAPGTELFLYAAMKFKKELSWRKR